MRYLLEGNKIRDAQFGKRITISTPHLFLIEVERYQKSYSVISTNRYPDEVRYA